MKASAILLLAGCCLVAPGCESPTGGGAGARITISARTAAVPTIAANRPGGEGSARATGAPPAPSGSGAAAADSIRLTRVRVLLRDIRLHRESDSADVRTQPVVLDLVPDGTLHDIVVASLPEGSYRRLRFRVHRIEDEDVRGIPPAMRPGFDDFLAGDRWSIIAEGTVYSGGVGEAFVFRSRIDEEQEREFVPELAVAAGAPVTVTMTLDAASWFSDGAGGLVDPRDPSSGDAIDDRIRESIDLFEDNDRDGNPG